MSCRTGSRTRRASSGSRSASSSIEPFRSAKRTVTCLRSPSRAAFDVRIFSARCFGVYESGAANLAVGPVRSGVAQWPQNLFSGGFPAPHDGQTAARGAAHSPQNFMPGGFSCWHGPGQRAPARSRAGCARPWAARRHSHSSGPTAKRRVHQADQASWAIQIPSTIRSWPTRSTRAKSPRPCP